MSKLHRMRTSKIGLDLKNYTEISTLGTGSFGVVKLAKENSSEKLYAIKILSKKHLEH